jgi:hypothetical protein
VTGPKSPSATCGKAHIHQIPTMAAHQCAGQDDAMSVGPVQYTIRVDGHLGPAIRSAFPELVAQEVAQTVLTGFLDRSALSGVLAQLEMLGVELVEVHQVPLAEPHHSHKSHHSHETPGEKSW